MQDLVVSTIQTTLEWENVNTNLAHFETKIHALPQTDLIVLPEMFNSGFSMNAEGLAEEPNGFTSQWMLKMAEKKDALVAGSIIIRENGDFFNRLIAACPDGKILTYDKRHLFSMAEEDKTFASGSSRVIVPWRGWKILPLVCYDLRFPVWSRNTTSDGDLHYDLLIYVANWPAARILAWDTLLKARAVENLAYCVGTNRTGEDENGIKYNGHTGIYDPKGNTIYFSEKDESHTSTLSATDLTSYRKKFPANLDADNFSLRD